MPIFPPQSHSTTAFVLRPDFLNLGKYSFRFISQITNRVYPRLAEPPPERVPLLPTTGFPLEILATKNIRQSLTGFAACLRPYEPLGERLFHGRKQPGCPYPKTGSGGKSPPRMSLAPSKPSQPSMAVA